ncbi:hypothetical protein NDU88_001621 [Pleurodeles waltl]|uniref:Uncharacterized protein n=1 Tax=Pleurodeles waltl TaxID=8319 RepID=A0AAV7RBE4_PLEWA|nr:hypothetical protein NDU88_001621 [Pleurodeles waltl]
METPFMLLKGRKPCSIAVLGWIGRAGKGKIDEEKLSDRVKKVQEKYDGNVWSDAKRDRFVEGDWVRTGIYDGNRKGLSKWPPPKQVIDLRRYNVILDDGKRWSRESVVNKESCRKDMMVVMEVSRSGEKSDSLARIRTSKSKNEKNDNDKVAEQGWVAVTGHKWAEVLEEDRNKSVRKHTEIQQLANWKKETNRPSSANVSTPRQKHDLPSNPMDAEHIKRCFCTVPSLARRFQSVHARFQEQLWGSEPAVPTLARALRVLSGMCKVPGAEPESLSGSCCCYATPLPGCPRAGRVRALTFQRPFLTPETSQRQVSVISRRAGEVGMLLGAPPARSKWRRPWQCLPVTTGAAHLRAVLLRSHGATLI